MSAMDDTRPPDHADADGERSAPVTSSTTTPSPTSPIANDKGASMLEERTVHPVKRMWNTDADEAIETTKRARITESLDNTLHDNVSNEKLSHTNAVPSVLNQDKDTNGDGTSDHLPQDTSNGALENNSPLVNNTKDSSLQKSVDDKPGTPERETSGPPRDPCKAPMETSANPMDTGESRTAETCALNNSNDEESMDVDSDSPANSAPVTPKPSGLEPERTKTTDNDSKDSLEDSEMRSPSQTELIGQSRGGVETETKVSTADPSHPMEPLDRQSAIVTKQTGSSGEQNVDTKPSDDSPPRTDETSGTQESMPLNLKNGEGKPTTTPTGNVADLKDMIKERFKDKIENSVDFKQTNGKMTEGNGTNEVPTSTANNEPSRSSSPQDDVIVLSDDDVDGTPDDDDASSIDTGPFSPLPDDDPLSKLTDDELSQRDKAIRDLQEELRTEEGKLLLLKKLRQSQLQPVQVAPKEGATAATDTSSGSVVQPPQKANPTPNVNTSLPQLLRTAQGTKIHLTAQQQQQHLHQLKQLQQLQQQQQKAGGGSRIIQMPQLVRGSQIQTIGRSVLTSQSGPPPLVMVSRGGTQGQPIQGTRHIIRVSGTGTVSTTTIQSAGGQIVNQQSRTSTTMANDTQSAASRQAAAKLALRKQLEKTLLQIPPPKPPPPELHFLPSAANNEFIILVGLEEVVNTILEVEKDSKRKTPQRFTDPFRCAQCKTDFTTIWKQDAKQGIMCETCIVSNQKKSLKAEHTNRLKTAFVKALQQEQEIEQRMQQGQNPVIHSSQQTSRQHHQGSHIQSSQQNRHRVMNPVPHQQQRTVLNPAPNTQRVMQPVTYTYIPHVSGVKNSGQSFTYRVPTSQIQMVSKNQIVTSHHSANAARQREYLLDMIPSKVLNQNATVPWKR
ncbi:transcriptional repressor p66-alpha-like isoform X2 [Patiria miniata]|nr:transcriptional repressor p66-alpha-like isoform X2 [Patiria miniata]